MKATMQANNEERVRSRDLRDAYVHLVLERLQDRSEFLQGPG